MPGFLRPAIGNRRNRLKTAAKAAGAAFRPIKSIWGFGSAFRPGGSSDIDLLIVLSSHPRSILEDAVRAKQVLIRLLRRWRIPIDILVVTEREMRGRPLRDMHSLEPLFRRRSNMPREHPANRRQPNQRLLLSKSLR